MLRKIDINRYRNIGIVAHIDAGKTTTTERILYYTGVNHKIGEVHYGNTTTDWMIQEQERGITITSASITCFWSGINNLFNLHRINIIDTPGHVDFTIEVERSMRILDGVIMIYCSVGGVQSQSETVWKQANKYKIPKIAFVNKMDRTGADLFNVINQLNNKLNANAIPIQIGIYDTNNKFIGIIDLIKMKSIIWNDDFNGENFFYKDIPSNMTEISSKLNKKIIELIVEDSDYLLNKYLNNIDISEKEIKHSLRKKVINNEITLVLCGSSFKNKGVQTLLDAVIDYLPSPKDLNYIEGVFINNKNNIEKTKRFHNDNEPFSALAFKVVSDPFVGNLTFFRVYSGYVKLGDIVYNSNKKINEKFTKIVQMHANKRVDINKVYSGDIAAVIGLKNTYTGDTLCDIYNPIILESIYSPNPVISVAIEPKTKLDQDKIGLVLSKLSKEDPSMIVKVDSDSGQTIISGMGELHLDIITDRIKRDYNVNINVSEPNVSYKETIKSTSEMEGKYIRQSGGRGQYGHVWLRVEPTDNIEYKFVNNIVGGVIPKEFISSIDKGIRDQLKSGILFGYPIINIKVTVYDGSYHIVDSSEIAFRIASSIAFKSAFINADPILLEPIMNVDIDVPNEYTGDIIGDINKRRGVVYDVDDLLYNNKIIKAKIPLSELFGYSTSLRSKTKGRALYSMKFCMYKEIPENIINKKFTKKI